MPRADLGSTAGTVVERSPAIEVRSVPDALARRLPVASPLFVALVAFSGSLIVRAYRLPDVHFARDQAVALWMALDATRQGFVPDHGLVSSVLAYQPPGLIWLMVPAIMVGRGDPLVVMLCFAVLSSVGIAVLVWSVAQGWGVRLALLLAALLATNPADALAPALLWHVSLYMGAVALYLAAALQLNRGASRWWAFAVGGVPVAYTLIHYSGFMLFPIALVLLPARRWRGLALPFALGGLAGLLLWAPFALFEMRVGWQDLLAVAAAGGRDGALDRIDESARIVAAWGTGRWIEAGRVSAITFMLAVGGYVYGMLTRQPMARLAGICLIAGTILQAALGMGDRSDIGMLWNAPLLVLAALALQHLPHRAVTYGVLAGVIAGNLYIFARVHDQFIERGETLDQTRARAAMGDSWRRSAEDVQRTPPETARYLPSDPPVVAGTGSEVWYLREVAEPGAGRRAAAADAQSAQAGR
jgi:hypothetical protein